MRTTTRSARQSTTGASRSTTKAKQPAKVTRPAAPPVSKKMAGLLGVHPSELGALNAANASATALNNASPNSRVGRIATYRDTVLEGIAINEELVLKEEELAGLTEPDRPIPDIENDLEDALAEAQDNADRVRDLEAELEAAGGSDPDIEAELADARDALDASNQTVDDLTAERDAAVEYDETVAEVAELTELAEKQPEVERAALEDAANKPVTDEIEAAVKSILGL
ncbi:hypothetical protein [Ruegeria sp. HKCCD8929]|uniref:hypothetical protein n=1 Tax=Ruegeria sp. HKCCD8929 TaxID=2683006 RepID=UPI001487E240|nr:hypothetical protein [Ruegeria sp. HKCCD8929]